MLFNSIIKGKTFDVIAGLFDNQKDYDDCIRKLKCYNGKEPDLFIPHDYPKASDIDSVYVMCYVNPPPDGVSSNCYIYMVVLV